MAPLVPQLFNLANIVIKILMALKNLFFFFDDYLGSVRNIKFDDKACESWMSSVYCYKWL